MTHDEQSEQWCKQTRVEDEEDDSEPEDINRYGNSDELEDVLLKDTLRALTEEDFRHMWDEDGGKDQWTNLSDDQWTNKGNRTQS